MALLHAAAGVGAAAAAAPAASPVAAAAAVQPALMLRHLGRRALSLRPPHAAAAGSDASRAGLRQPSAVVAAAAAGRNRSSLSTATAASSNSDDSSVSSVQHAQMLLDTVAKAIEYEARLSYPNAQGREHSFADFASGALQEVATEGGLEQAGAHSSSSSSLGALQQQLQQASQSLFGYGSLDGEGRKQLLQQLQAGVLQQARQLLAAPSSTQPRDHAGDTSTASSSSSSSSSGSSEHSSSEPQQQAAAGRRPGPLPRPGSRQQQQQHAQQNTAEPVQAPQPPSSPHPPRPRSPSGPLPILRPAAAAAAVPSVQQQQPRPQSPPPAPGAAQQQQSPRKPLLPLRTAAQQQQQQQPLQPTVLPPAAAAQAPLVSSSRHVGPLAPVRRIAAMQGPNPPRAHMPYPTQQTPALEQAKAHQKQPPQPQQQQWQRQQRLHVPAWQLYFPLPEALGGPPSPPSSQPQQPVAVAAAPDAAAAASASPSPSSDEASSPDEGEAAGSSSGRRRRRSTQNSDAMWDAFVAAAMHAQEWERKKQQHLKKEAAGQLKQRSDSWLRLRESRLTGSALANMLSWFGKDKNEQVRLWKEKLKLQAPPPPNDKMKYGTRQEPHALASYQHLAPHETLADMGFAVWGADDAHDWLAASPDGLITCAEGLEQVMQQSSSGGGGRQQQQDEEPAGVSVAEWVRKQTGSSLEGVLEIKCPYKASPNAPQPFLPHRADAYYMPQVQVLCEVLDREWAVVFYWSEELGSHMTLIHRDREYFALLWQAMVDFWWRHVVPAKLALDADPASREAVEASYTPGLHPYRDEIVRLSEAMVAAAPQRTFTPAQTRAAASCLAAASLAASDVDHSELREVSGRVAVAATAELGA